jgi:hypothetical protein
VSKHVLHVFDEDGKPVAGKAIARRGHWYGLLDDVRFWDVRPRSALTPALEKEKLWLLGLHAADIEPQQPGLIAKSSSLGDTLQQNSGERIESNISPTPGAGLDANAGRLNRSVRDAGPGGLHRESVGSVPADLAMRAAGVKPLPPTAFETESPAAASTETIEPQWARDLAALKESLGGVSTHTQQAESANLPKREVQQEKLPKREVFPPKKGGFSSQKGRFSEPGSGGSDETSQKGRFADWPGTIGQSGDSPKKGGLPTLSALSASGVLVHNETSETLNAGRRRVSQAELEFMERYRALCGELGESYLGYWRRRFRSPAHRELVECVLERTEIRKRSPAMEALDSPGAWMRDEFLRGLRKFGLMDLPPKAVV